MSLVRNKKLWMAMVVCAAGTLFQILPVGCRNYAAEQALTAFDFCKVFNCTGGTFFNFCSPTAIFTDCPTTTTTTQ